MCAINLLRVKAIAVHWERRLVVLAGHIIELPSDEINEYARGGWPKADAKHLKLLCWLLHSSVFFYAAACIEEREVKDGRMGEKGMGEGGNLYDGL